ncbi:MAG TPA: hypothetical protein VL382_08505 [Terriglobales bacterium]|nr:hypothetical protein [Terriglobales bacterium]
MRQPHQDVYGRELLELLKQELLFVEQGGYGRSVHKPQDPTNVFKDSPTCLNFGEGRRVHDCDQCLLTQMVPEEKRGEDQPCHHIPLNAKGDTIAKLEGNDLKTQEAVADWLRKVISNLESLRNVVA